MAAEPGCPFDGAQRRRAVLVLLISVPSQLQGKVEAAAHRGQDPDGNNSRTGSNGEQLPPNVLQGVPGRGARPPRRQDPAQPRQPRPGAPAPSPRHPGQWREQPPLERDAGLPRHGFRRPQRLAGEPHSANPSADDRIGHHFVLSPGRSGDNAERRQRQQRREHVFRGCPQAGRERNPPQQQLPPKRAAEHDEPPRPEQMRRARAPPGPLHCARPANTHPRRRARGDRTPAEEGPAQAAAGALHRGGRDRRRRRPQGAIPAAHKRPPPA
mmetsp:Transcript_16909/g.40307  ORF Transcript_16909/g.40307 Transcript_16909/m.40307 type:complete len:269 (+) Transcript_16909:2577-3383(+)